MVMVFCRGCGKEIHDSAVNCPHCGATQSTRPTTSMSVPPATDKRILPAFLLCFFIGIFGAHRFYVGKIGSGVAQLLTIGGLGLWTLADLIMLACGVFTDANGQKITVWA